MRIVNGASVARCWSKRSAGCTEWSVGRCWSKAKASWMEGCERCGAVKQAKLQMKRGDRLTAGALLIYCQILHNFIASGRLRPVLCHVWQRGICLCCVSASSTCAPVGSSCAQVGGGLSSALRYVYSLFTQPNVSYL